VQESALEHDRPASRGEAASASSCSIVLFGIPGWSSALYCERPRVTFGEEGTCGMTHAPPGVQRTSPWPWPVDVPGEPAGRGGV
jgi:hypothetical protein